MNIKNIYKQKNSCRLCGSKKLVLALTMGKSPVSEKYEVKYELARDHQLVPLDLYFCNNCFHVQLIHVVDPDYLWSDFTFKTGNKKVLVEHMKEEVIKMISFSDISKNEYVVDVGSNDGTLLKCFQDKGFKNVVGVEPAYEIAQEAILNGVNTIVGYMNPTSVKQFLNNNKPAKIVTAFNVYAHADDLAGMTQAIKTVLADDGLFVFEASYLLDVIQKMLIGTIFHEHLSYHSVISMERFLNSLDLQLIHVETAKEQGGSLIGYIQHKGGPFQRSNSVMDFISHEKQAGLDCLNPFENLQDKLDSQKNKINEFFKYIKYNNKTIGAYGAARSGTTLLSFFDIGSKIDFIVDDNEEKHFKYSPGFGIQVLPVSSIYDNNPDYLIILAWMHAETIISKNISFLEKGGKFIKIHPEFEIVDIDSIKN